MKVKTGYLMREIADTCVIVPIGERVIDFKGMFTLKGIGGFIWNRMQTDVAYDELLAAILDEYDIDKDQAQSDLDNFLQKIRDLGVIDE